MRTASAVCTKARTLPLASLILISLRGTPRAGGRAAESGLRAGRGPSRQPGDDRTDFVLRERTQRLRTDVALGADRIAERGEALIVRGLGDGDDVVFAERPVDLLHFAAEG